MIQIASLAVVTCGLLPPSSHPAVTQQSPSLALLDNDLIFPTAVTTWPGNPNILVVAERGTALIQRIAVVSGQINPRWTLLDLSTKVVGTPTAGCVDLFGVTGVAFHPDFETDRAKRLLYVRYNANNPTGGSITRVEEYSIPPGAIAADPSSARMLVEYDDRDGHITGQLAFEKNAAGVGGERLLVPTGDNTGAFGLPQPGGGASGTGDCFLALDVQTPGLLTGRLLAIDVNSAVTPPPLFELANGFRNPWGIGVDSGDAGGAGRGEIWIGDTGDLTSGNVMRLSGTGPVPNFGWPCYEFKDNLVAAGLPVDFQPGACAAEAGCSTVATPDLPVLALQKVTLYGGSPLAQQRDAIIGGFVYRGTSLPTLNGRYIFGTFGVISPGGQASPMPKLMSVDATTPNTQPIGELGSVIGGPGGVAGVPQAFNLSVIAEGGDGEPLLIFQRCGNGAGRVYRIVP